MAIPTWPSRLGHPSDEAIRHLSNASTGVKITDAEIAKPKAGEPRPLNEIQELAVAKEQISRRKAIKATRPFERLCWDMIFLSTPAYNADTIVSHFYDPYLHLHLTETLWKKGESVDSIIGMVNKIERKFPQYKVAIIQTDEEQILVNSNKFNAFIKDRFWDTSPPYVHQPNGAIERAGQAILARGRALRIDSNLPKELWPEPIKAATDLLNLTPIYSLNWKSPLGLLYELLNLPKPSLAHLRAYGCRVYVRDTNIQKGDKMEPRSYIGYLVGYDSSNIFRIWVPHRRTVIRARDVRFDETKRYDPQEVNLVDKLRQRVDDIIEVIEIPGTTCQVDELLHFTSIEQPDPSVYVDKEAEPDQQPLSQLLTPDTTPAPEFTVPMPSTPESIEESSTDPFDMPLPPSPESQILVDTSPQPDEQAEARLITPMVPARGGEKTTVSADLDPAHIIEGPRTRKQSGRRAAYLAHLDGGTSEMRAAFNSLNKAAVPYRELRATLNPTEWME